MKNAHDKKEDLKKIIESIIEDPQSFIKKRKIKVPRELKEKLISAPKSWVKIHYEDEIGERGINAAEFVFWYSFFYEKILTDALRDSLKESCPGALYPELMLKKLSLGQKISIVKEATGKSNKKHPITKLYEKIIKLRNNVSHGKFDELKYNGGHLSEPGTQFKLLIDSLLAVTPPNFFKGKTNNLKKKGK